MNADLQSLLAEIAEWDGARAPKPADFTHRVAAVFHQCGRALFGEHYVAPLAAQLRLKPSNVDDMRKGRSKIPLGIWSEIAAMVHDRERTLPQLRAAAIALSVMPLTRTYRCADGMSFDVYPDVTGRFPTIEYGDGYPIGFWAALPDDVRSLPRQAAAMRLVFNGEQGNITPLHAGKDVFYPPNMKVAR